VPSAPAPVVIRHDRGPFALLLLAVLAVLWLSRAVLGPFIVAGVIAYAFSPLLSSTQRRMGWPRVVVAAIGYVSAIAISAVLVSSPGDTLHVVGQVGEFGLQTILTIIISFYLLVDGDLFMDRAIALLPGSHRARTVDVLARIHIVLGKWLRGQILLIALVAAV